MRKKEGIGWVKGVSKRAFLESPDNVSDPKSYVLCSMLTKKYSIFVDIKSKAIKSKVDDKRYAGLWVKNFISTRKKLKFEIALGPEKSSGVSEFKYTRQGPVAYSRFFCNRPLRSVGFSRVLFGLPILVIPPSADLCVIARVEILRNKGNGFI